MSKNTFTAKKRDNSQNPRQLRRNGKIPATLYGKDSESLSLEIDAREFTSAYKLDKNAIFAIKIGKDSFDSIVKKVQTKNVKDDILNVEFQKIRSDAAIKMVIPVEITGESPAVKAGGNLITSLTEIEVECLPKDIPSEIKIDISSIENLDESITIGDVKYPAGVKPTGSEDTVVLRISSPEAEVSEEGAAEEVSEAAAAEEKGEE